MIGRSMSLHQVDSRTPVLVLFRINVNSGCDWGVSDPLAVYKDDGTHGRARDFFRAIRKVAYECTRAMSGSFTIPGAAGYSR